MIDWTSASWPRSLMRFAVRADQSATRVARRIIYYPATVTVRETLSYRMVFALLDEPIRLSMFRARESK